MNLSISWFWFVNWTCCSILWIFLLIWDFGSLWFLRLPLHIHFTVGKTQNASRNLTQNPPDFVRHRTHLQNASRNLTEMVNAIVGFAWVLHSICKFYWTFEIVISMFLRLCRVNLTMLLLVRHWGGSFWGLSLLEFCVLYICECNWIWDRNIHVSDCFNTTKKQMDFDRICTS